MLFRQEKIENKFLKIAQEHEIIIKHLDTMREIIDKKASTEGLEQLKEFLPVLKQDMKYHFKIEEQFLFPAALLSIPEIEMVDIITVMIKEHGYVERDLETLEGLINENNKNKKSGEPVFNLLENLIGDIEKHANTEMNRIFPKMDGNKRCQKIIKGILLE